VFLGRFNADKAFSGKHPREKLALAEMAGAAGNTWACRLAFKASNQRHLAMFAYFYFEKHCAQLRWAGRASQRE